MLTPERLAELELVLARLWDEECERQFRAAIEHERAERAKAHKLPAPPPIEGRWVIAAALPPHRIAPGPAT